MSFAKIVIFIIVMICSSAAFSQITPADQERAIDQLQKTQQKQDNLIKYLGKEYERKAREKQKPTIDIPNAQNVGIKEGQCFDIAEVNLEGAEHISEHEIDKLTTAYLNTCMDIASIDKLMRDITNYYFEKGYVTTRLAIPAQDLKDGSLELIVVEGRIEEIIINDNLLKDKIQTKTAFPNLIGKILNIRDIEQGLDQINRLSSANATMKLEPGTKNGYSRIVIINNSEKNNRVSVGYNNTGQASTGKNKASIYFERDNLLGAGEHLSFNFNKDTADDSISQGSELLSGQFSIPLGYWTLSSNIAHSEYRTTIAGTNQSFRSFGQTDSGTVSLDRVIHRSQHSKTNMSTSFTHKNTTAFIENFEISTGTHALSIAKIGLDHTHRVFGGILYGSIGYEKGLDLLGARKDGDNLFFTNPRAQFNKITFDASIYKPFAYKKLNFAYRTIASGQYSTDPLFSSEQINIGDRYTVRGFQSESISGDTGGYIRNEVMLNAPINSKYSYLNNMISGIQPYTGVDVGWSRVRGGKSVNISGESYVSGFVLGLRNSSEWLDFDIAYAKQIKTPGYFVGAEDELYFSVSTKIGF